MYVFEVIDKTGRKVRLSTERWAHIRKEHPEIEYFEEIKETIVRPDKYSVDTHKALFYKYWKHKRPRVRFMVVIVSYLYDKGFVVTAYCRPNIRW